MMNYLLAVLKLRSQDIAVCCGGCVVGVFVPYVNCCKKVRSSVPPPALQTSNFILLFSKGMSLNNRSNPEHSTGCFLCVMAGTAIYLFPSTSHSVNQGNLKILNPQLILISLLKLFPLYYPSFWKPLHILSAYITRIYLLIIQTFLLVILLLICPLETY